MSEPVELDEYLTDEEKLKNIGDFWEQHGLIGFLKVFRGQMLDRISNVAEIPREEVESYLKGRGVLKDIDELERLLQEGTP